MGGVRAVGRCRTRLSQGGLERGRRKKGLSTELGSALAKETEKLIGQGALEDFESFEIALRDHALRLAARMVERQLNADHSDAATSYKPCSCGGEARFVDRRQKSFLTVLGEIALERGYYHCAACQRGFCPRDQLLGLDASVSPGVLHMISASAALVSFEESSELLVELAGLRVNAKQVERCAEMVGDEIIDDERRVVEAADAPSAPTLYLGMDGTGVPMRKEALVGRQGKQEDGSAKTREMKLCTVFSAEGHDADGVPMRDHGSVTYSAAIESAASKDPDDEPSEFAGRVQREATRRGFERAQRQVVLGDGAPWIWNLATDLFPDAIQIVDRFHAKQSLSQVAKAIFGDGSPIAASWSEQRHAELDAGELDSLIAAVADHRERNEAARRCCKHLETNRLRMRYPEFRSQGLCTSSGVVEAGCKNVVGARLKRSGMHWTLRGAGAIAALRAARLSRRLPDFWDRRRLSRKAA